MKHNEKHECSSISIPFLNDRKKETSAKLHLPVISYSYTNTIGSSVDSVLIANIFHTSSKIIPPSLCMKYSNTGSEITSIYTAFQGYTVTTKCCQIWVMLLLLKRSTSLLKNALVTFFFAFGSNFSEIYLTICLRILWYLKIRLQIIKLDLEIIRVDATITWEVNFVIYYVFYSSNTTGVTCEVGSVNTSWVLYRPVFY